MSMMAGRLRKSVKFQTRGTSVDSYGQQVTTWTDAFSTRASIEPFSVREQFAAQAVHSEISHRIAVRYRSELANGVAVAAMRVLYGTRVFNIVGALNIDERHAIVEISATEGLNDG